MNYGFHPEAEIELTNDPDLPRRHGEARNPPCHSVSPWLTKLLTKLHN